MFRVIHDRCFYSLLFHHYRVKKNGRRNDKAAHTFSRINRNPEKALSISYLLWRELNFTEEELTTILTKVFLITKISQYKKHNLLKGCRISYC